MVFNGGKGGNMNKPLLIGIILFMVIGLTNVIMLIIKMGKLRKRMRKLGIPIPPPR